MSNQKRYLFALLRSGLTWSPSRMAYASAGGSTCSYSGWSLHFQHHSTSITHHALPNPSRTLSLFHSASEILPSDCRQSQPWQQGRWQQSREFRSQAPIMLLKHKGDLDESKDLNRIVEELRYRNIKVPRQLDISWRRRIEDSFRALLGAVRAVINFCASIPCLIRTGSRMSFQEWRETIVGWWVTIKHEAHHYWVGFKLFGLELKVATRLIWKQLKGKRLTRRENKQLTRTTADIVRVVPFTMFIIIPFAEFLLPVALRIFPNMLPSTFQTQLKQEEDMKKLLKLKTELARFLQQTVGELAKDVKRSRSGEVADEARALAKFLKDVRGGRTVSNADIVKFARLFSDEITLDNLDRVHLVTLCQFLSLNNMGNEAFLRMRLRTHLNEIKNDDVEIKKEGIDQLTDDELRAACRARGMPAPFGRGCTSKMQNQLKDWIELSLDRNIPPSLLLLSRAFKIKTVPKKKKDPTVETVEDLKDMFNMLPSETIEDVEMESFKSSASPEKKLEYLQRVEQDIKEENEEAAEAREDLEEEMGQRINAAVAANARATAKAVVRKATARAVKDEISREAEQLGDTSHGQEQLLHAHAKEERMGALISSLVALASASGVAQERALFLDVANSAVQSELNKLQGPAGSYLLFDGAAQSIVSVRPELEMQQPDKLSQRVSQSVDEMLLRIEGELERAESQIGERMHMLDQDNDGMISRQELVDAFQVLNTDFTENEMNALNELLGDTEKISVSKLQSLSSHMSELSSKEMLRSDA